MAEANRRRPIYGSAVQVLANFLRTIEKTELHPEIVDRSGYQAVRYVKQVPEEALILKYAALVSLNGTLLMLMDAGKILEQGMIQRAIEETNEDICFIAINVTGTAKSEKFDTHLAEFWKEDYQDPSDPSGTQIRRGYSRRGIRAFINRSVGQTNPSTADAQSKAIYAMYSGYTHGAAPQLLEIYNYEKRQFEERGILGSNRHLDYVFDAQNSIYRSILSMGQISKAFGSEKLFEESIRHRDQFEELIGREFIIKEP